MKDLLVLCLCIIVIAFTIATVVGCVMATIDIIRSPKRYKISESVESVPADFLAESESDSEVDFKKDDKRVIM